MIDKELPTDALPEGVKVALGVTKPEEHRRGVVRPPGYGQRVQPYPEETRIDVEEEVLPSVVVVGVEHDQLAVLSLSSGATTTARSEAFKVLAPRRLSSRMAL
jgi:hypothetical protein